MPATKKVTTTKTKTTEQGYFEKLENEIKSNNSPLSLVLGALIILVVGILIFNFFNQKKEGTIDQKAAEQASDVAIDKLPGKYTVKEGDTLFTIADHYYKDGYKFENIAKENKLTDVNSITVGQVLEIPKITEVVAQASTSPSASATPSPTPTPSMSATPPVMETSTGGADVTVWGPKINGDTYTVVEGDWLSTISARAYGDIFAYTKIASANNIQNPDVIEPGQVLKLPR